MNMSIKIVVAEAHQNQLQDESVKREIDSISQEINKLQLGFKENTVNFVFIKGLYIHAERKMTTVGLFVNKMSPIKELHGELRLKFLYENAIIAKSTINFDERFLGELKTDDALLVHINIPVKGLVCNHEYKKSDISGTFDNVKATMI